MSPPPPALEPKAKRTYTTPEELERYQDLVDKIFVRKGGKDHTKYKPVTVYPEFSSVTAEDRVDIFDSNGEKIGEGYQYLVRLNIENFIEEPITVAGKRIAQRKAIGSFNCYASEFLEKFSMVEGAKT